MKIEIVTKGDKTFMGIGPGPEDDPATFKMPDKGAVVLTLLELAKSVITNQGTQDESKIIPATFQPRFVKGSN